MATTRNGTLVKIGSLLTANGGQTSGHTQMQLVQPAVALPDPGGFDGSPSWHAKRAQYVQSVQITQKFSQDWE